MKVEIERHFSEAEHETWAKLFSNLERSRKTQAHPIFSEGVEKLGLSSRHIPSIKDVNSRLVKLTGWRGIPVEGLEEAGSFFHALREKTFPIGNFIRDAGDMSYTPAPDIFHDLYGHLPFLANDEYADFCHRFGEMACRYIDQPILLRQFERLFWFAVEFPIIEGADGDRIFGGGILSSSSECDYALSDKPKVLPFNIEDIRARDYKIDEMQTTIFKFKTPQELYSCLESFEAGLQDDRPRQRLGYLG